MVDVTIDPDSGFCFGVVNAIRSAERELSRTDELYSLGDIVHNSLEVDRLRSIGLHTIEHADLARLEGRTVLLRAHGEPPSTYRAAHEHHIRIIDATCPVVLQLQRRIHRCYNEIKGTPAQLVIYGKKGHAEVNGLVGQTEGTAIVIEHPEEAERLDFTRDIYLFSQTTKSLEGFGRVVDLIRARIAPSARFRYFDTICRQVSNRLSTIRDFAARHDRIYFVAGKKSSNGQMLYEQCRQANPHSVFISGAEEITEPLPPTVHSVGVCGATSTPKWLMEEVAERVRRLNNVSPT